MEKANPVDANTMFYRNFIDSTIRLEVLESFLKEFNKLIEVTRKRLISVLKRAKGSIELDEFTFILNPHDFKYIEIIRKSFIITLVILLEKEIGIYCDEFKEQLNLKIGWKDFRGAALDRFKLFINKLVKLKLSISNTTWKDLHSIVAIRNCLIHADGCLQNFSEANKVKDFARRYNSLKIQGNFLQISLRTCEDCLGIVREFIEAIYDDALLFFPGDFPIKMQQDN